MPLFDCLEDNMSELELEIIESLSYSPHPNLSHNALLSFILDREIKSSKSYLTTQKYILHIETYNYIQDLYIGRYIERFGHEPTTFK